jgi:hypothetical protein
MDQDPFLLTKEPLPLAFMSIYKFIMTTTRKYKHVLAGCLSIIILTGNIGCKKGFLDIVPKGRIVAEKASDYDLLLNNSSLFSLQGNAAIVMGDDVATVQSFFMGATVKAQRQYNWSPVIFEPAENSDELTNLMQMVYIYNKIITELPAVTDGIEADNKAVLAEAKAGRAYCYFMLINYFAKPYNAATAGNDPGFPLVTVNKVTETKFVRASVQEVYDFIIKDLTEAIPDLKITPKARIRMSRPAAEGLLGKIYLFMNRPQNALPLLNASVTDMAGSLIPMRLYNYNTELGTGGSFLPISTFGPTYPVPTDVLENMYVKQVSNAYAFVSNVLPMAPVTRGLYDNADLRLKFYSPGPYPSGNAFPDSMTRKMSPSSHNMAVSVSDVYLLRAECKARLNDLTGAKADVETLRNNRMPLTISGVPLSVATQQIPLLKFIMEERGREFSVTGFRWFDMRRLSVDPLIPQTGFSHRIYGTGNAFTTITLPLERLTMRFPQRLMDQNSGMPNNP